jgi:hypothetical protein
MYENAPFWFSRVSVWIRRFFRLFGECFGMVVGLFCIFLALDYFPCHIYPPSNCWRIKVISSHLFSLTQLLPVYE